jgi:hypothetical protein
LIEVAELLEEGNSDSQEDEDVDEAADVLSLVHYYESGVMFNGST